MDSLIGVAIGTLFVVGIGALGYLRARSRAEQRGEAAKASYQRRPA